MSYILLSLPLQRKDSEVRILFYKKKIADVERQIKLEVQKFDKLWSEVGGQYCSWQKEYYVAIRSREIARLDDWLQLARRHLFALEHPRSPKSDAWHPDQMSIV